MNPAVCPPLRLGAAVGVSDSLVFIHGGAAVGTNGYATTGVLNDLTKLVSLSILKAYPAPYDHTGSCLLHAVMF